MKKVIAWERASYKDYIGVSAAPVFWVASLVCFVLGLSFKSGTGIYIPGTTLDIMIVFSIALGFANTAIQIVGNDTDREDLGMALFLMWGASYMLGIGSNVNFLYSVIGLNHPLLQFLVCWGLGIMIEVAPERLLVKFLRAIGILDSKNQSPKQGNHNNHHGQPSREQRHDSLRTVREVPNEFRHQKDPKVVQQMWKEMHSQSGSQRSIQPPELPQRPEFSNNGEELPEFLRRRE